MKEYTRVLWSWSTCAFENPTYAAPGCLFVFMHFRGSVSVLCTSNQLLYLPYMWDCVRIHALVSQTAQQLCPLKVQLSPATSEKLGSSKGEVPALKGRVQEFKESTESKGSSPRGDCNERKAQSCSRATRIGSGEAKPVPQKMVR